MNQLKLKFFLPLAGAVAMAAGTAMADSGGIKVSEVWARATPGAVKSGAIYLTITNTGSTPDSLEGASTPAAATTSLHEMKTVNGVMEMRPVKSITIEPGKSLVLAPSGYHLMLEGLKAPLKEGASVPLSLTFAKAGTENVTASVAKVGAMHAGEMSGGGGAVMGTMGAPPSGAPGSMNMH